MQGQVDATASVLNSAERARRAYLLEKIAKERVTLDQLAATKAKAAREEKGQLAE